MKNNEKLEKSENYDNFEKIVIIDNEVQTCLICSLLDEQKIPYFAKSYHDMAYDGLFQNSKGWGHLEAPAEFKNEIIKIKDGLMD